MCVCVCVCVCRGREKCKRSSQAPDQGGLISHSEEEGFDFEGKEEALKGLDQPRTQSNWWVIFGFFLAMPLACGNSQARGRIKVTDGSLCHSHSNSGSEPHLPSTPQLTATPDP